jgi:hypothetical protein
MTIIKIEDAIVYELFDKVDCLQKAVANLTRIIIKSLDDKDKRYQEEERRYEERKILKRERG